MKETLRRAREALGGTPRGRRTTLGRIDQAVTTRWLRELGGRASETPVTIGAPASGGAS